MATESITALRRFAGFVFTMLFLGVCLCAGAAGQSVAPPTVLSNTTTAPFNSTTQNGVSFSNVWNIAISQQGDILIEDFGAGALYQVPADGRPTITITSSGMGTWDEMGIAIDYQNNIIIGCPNWCGGLYKIPYDPVNKTWNWATAAAWAPTANAHADAMSLNSNGTMAIAMEYGPWIDTMPVSSAGVAGTATQVTGKLVERVLDIAIDDAGDIVWVENLKGSNPPAKNVYWISAATAALGTATEDTALDVSTSNASSAVAIADTNFKGTAANGVAVDAAGNIYISDANIGVYVVPLENGTPNPADSYLLSSVPATDGLAIDRVRGTLIVPTTQTSTAKSMWENAGYYAVIKYGAGDVGSFNVGGSQVTFYTMPDWGEYPDGSTSVWYRFYGSVEPAKFAFQEDGVATQDFELVSLTAPSAGTFKIPQCALGTIYNSGDVCFVQVALNPQAAGSVSAQLLMQTASTTTGSDGKSVTTYTTVGSTTLHGTGVGPNVNVIPALESTSGSGLKTPSETATDAQGNVYVADAGLGEVVEFAAGSGTPVAVGAGFTAPTGVAVDGNGDVFVADSGNIFEIPYLSTAAPAQLASGLGSNLSLAADGLGNLYVADPSNARVVKLWNLGATQSGLLGQTEAFLTSGFTTPSAVAVDSSNNLYVVDGANLIEVSPSGTSTLLTSLSNAKGLAVDASGAVYIASTGGTSRIPSASGTLNPSSATVIASTVTNPAGVAIDRLGNVYLSDATALNIHKVQTTGTLDFGTLTAATATNTLSATVMNTGNSSLTVTGYSATSAPGGSTSYYPLEYDYYPTDVSCETAAIAAGGNCAFDVEFNPASGDQGTLTSVISIADNATNGTVGLDTTGVAASLAGSTVSFTVGSGSEVINTTVSVTVKATSGTVVPTGEVTVSYPSPTTTLDKSNNPTNQTLTQTVTLTNGAASFTLAPVAAGTTSFTVSYQGDRVFGKASLTATGTIAKSSVIGMVLPAAKTIPMYILENASANGNNSYPYDGKEGAWVYSMPVQVTAKAGTPTGILEFLDSGSVACPTNSGAGTPYLDTTGSVSFNMGCLPMATNLTYTPVISTHVITLSYAGDSNYNGYKYPSSFTFIAVRSPAVLVTKVDTTATTMATTISATDGSSTIATPVTVTAGSSTSVTLTLTSVLGYGIAGSNQQLNNYTFPLSLTCDNLPPHATCTFTYPTPDANLSTAFDISGCDLNGTAPDLPNPYQITGRGCQPGQVVVTINTNVATGTSTTSRNNHSSPFKTGAMLAAGLMGLFFSRKMRRGWRAMMTGLVCLFFLGAALLGSTACSTKNLTPISTLTTPAGTYNVKIVAQQVGTLVVTGSGASTTITGSQNPDSIPFTLPVTVQ